MTTHKIKFTKTPPCSTDEEFALWMVDNRYMRGGYFCDDCTIDYQSKMDAKGLCMSEKLRRNSEQ